MPPDHDPGNTRTNLLIGTLTALAAVLGVLAAVVLAVTGH